MDSFALRQFNTSFKGTTINYDPVEFETKINDLYVLNKDLPNFLHDGYAPFCKHIIVENFTDATPGTIEITDEIESLIRTSYEARRAEELPVLKRFVRTKDLGKLEKAKYLDVILYSKDQVLLENEKMENNEHVSKDFDYAIISVKAQDVDYEFPMDPITMMRNALGAEEGGSGVPLDRKKYLESVEYWSKHVLLA